MREVQLNELQFMQWLLDSNCTDPKPLDEKRYVAIMPMMFTKAIIVGSIGNEVGYEDRWCYDTYEEAKTALDKWTGIGEPQGWKRHPASGRRRPEGDLEREYINP